MEMRETENRLPCASVTPVPHGKPRFQVPCQFRMKDKRRVAGSGHSAEPREVAVFWFEADFESPRCSGDAEDVHLLALCGST